MWEEIFNLAVNNGIWAVLFLALLVYQLKDSRTREEKYQKTIVGLSESLKVVHDISLMVKDTKQKVEKVDTEVGQIKKVLHFKHKPEPDGQPLSAKEVKNEN